MENLHSDILENIFSRLHMEVALHAKRVSTTWRAILRYKSEKPCFLFARGRSYQLELFYEDEKDEKDDSKMNYYHPCNTLTKIAHGIFMKKPLVKIIMVGSCIGLVCFVKYSKYGADPLFLIFNPLTAESVFLPDYNYAELPRHVSSTSLIPYGCLTSGFGHFPETNEYKVVTIYYYDRESKGHVQVYTVGRKWRYIGYIGRYDIYNFDSSPGIYANGALYWLQEKLNFEIVAFDLEGEEFHYITLLRSILFNYRAYGHSSLWLLGGNNILYLVHKSFPINIWVCKRNKRNIAGTSYAMKECKSSSYPTKELSIQLDRQRTWTKEFSIQLDKPFISSSPFAITRSNKVLLWYNAPMVKRLYCYDPKNSNLNELWDDIEYVDQAIPHTQSIVSLNDLGETNLTSLKVRDDVKTIATTKTRKVKYEKKKKQAGSRDAKKLKIC